MKEVRKAVIQFTGIDFCEECIKVVSDGTDTKQLQRAKSGSNMVLSTLTEIVRTDGAEGSDLSDRNAIGLFWGKSRALRSIGSFKKSGGSNNNDDSVIRINVDDGGDERIGQFGKLNFHICD